MTQSDGQDKVFGATLNEDWQIVESLLPEHWQSMARELGAFRRARGVRDPRSLLQLMLIHLAGGCSLRETVARAELAGIARISDVALLKRLRGCGPWFEWLGQRLRQSPELRQAGALLASALGGRRVYAVDGSIVSEPGPTGSQWRLHYALGLPDLHCQQVHLSNWREGESLKRFEVRPGDVLLADRGYAHPGGIAHVCSHGGEVIVRMNLVTLPLHELAAPGKKAGARMDILAQACGLPVGQAMSWPACVRVKSHLKGQPSQVIAGRLCAIRKSQQAAARACQRVRRESQRNGSVLQPQTLQAAQYVFVFTSLSESISARQVLEIYRLRWQIELAFKHLKGLIGLGHLKKHDAQAARSWLQGKLLVALLIARLIAQAERVSPWGYEICSREPTRELPLARDGADARVAVPRADAGHDAQGCLAPLARVAHKTGRAATKAKAAEHMG